MNIYCYKNKVAFNRYKHRYLGLNYRNGGMPQIAMAYPRSCNLTPYNTIHNQENSSKQVKIRIVKIKML